MDTNHALNIRGDLVGLGPLRRDLLPTYTRWRNDFAIARTREYAPVPVTPEQRQPWFDQAVRATDSVQFTVYELVTTTPIGLTNLLHIDFQQGTADYGISINEPSAHGKGYGTETTRLMLDYAFTTLGLRNVMLQVYAYNHAGMRAYQKAGFREIGRRREAHIFSGRAWDIVFMDCIVTEHRASFEGIQDSE